MRVTPPWPSIPPRNLPLTTDQRGTGFRRVLGLSVDIGAYEFGDVPVLSGIPTNPSIGEGTPFTFTAMATDPAPARP